MITEWSFDMLRATCIEHFADCCGNIAMLTNFILNMEQQIFYDFWKCKQNTN